MRAMHDLSLVQIKIVIYEVGRFVARAGESLFMSRLNRAQPPKRRRGTVGFTFPIH